MDILESSDLLSAMKASQSNVCNIYLKRIRAHGAVCLAADEVPGDKTLWINDLPAVGHTVCIVADPLWCTRTTAINAHNLVRKSLHGRVVKKAGNSGDARAAAADMPLIAAFWHMYCGKLRQDVLTT